MQNVGTNAGLVWQALNGAEGALEQKLNKLADKDLYVIWLLREGKFP